MRSEATEKRKRVLFIEDEEQIVQGVSEFLMLRGFDVVGLSDPVEGERRWQEESFDVAIVDFSMPVPEGYDEEAVEFGRTTGLMTASRMHRTRPEIPIVALTVVREGLVAERLEETGIRQLLNKPVNPQDLVDALNSLVARSH